MKFCFLDTETRSRTDIGLGNDLYTRDAKCMIVTYAPSVFDGYKWTDTPTQIWEPWQDPLIPSSLRIAIEDGDVIFVAHNAVFDRFILLRALSIRIALKRWRCTRAQAYSAGLPGSLELLGIVVGLPEDQQKLVDDSKLIHTFCVPQGATDRFIEPWERPDDWRRFCNYAIRDTDALREIYKRLPSCNYVGINLRSWYLDQLVNERGFEFDRQLAVAAVDFLADAKVVSEDIVSRESAGEVHAATQRNKLLKYLREKRGLDIESLKASEVREWLEHDDLDPVVKILLEQRLEASRNPGAKLSRGLRMVGPRNRQRNTIQWNGAGRTGRHSGRGFQPHNMARPALTVRRSTGKIELAAVKAAYIDEVILPGIRSRAALNNPLVYGGPYEAVSLAVRHVITAALGNELVTGDFKNIESVITAWISNETLELKAFRDAFANPKDKSLDVYRLQFAAFFGIDPLAVNDTERQAGKVSKLAFGFGGGVGALVTMAAGYQMDLEPLADIILPRATEEQKAKAYKAWRRAFLTDNDFGLECNVYMACDVLKQIYRTTNANIDQMRRDVDYAIKDAIKEPMARVHNVARCKIWSTGSCLNIELPSGRRLLYWFPKVQEEDIEDPDGRPWTTEYVTYATARGKTWRRERAWAGLFVENIVQAIANDVLRAAMIRVHNDTMSVPEIKAYLDTLPEEERTAICLHVHDEVACDVPKGTYSKERMLSVLIQKEDWMDGLPMSADMWVNVRYGKR